MIPCCYLIKEKYRHKNDQVQYTWMKTLWIATMVAKNVVFNILHAGYTLQSQIKSLSECYRTRKSIYNCFKINVHKCTLLASMCHWTMKILSSIFVPWKQFPQYWSQCGVDFHAVLFTQFITASRATVHFSFERPLQATLYKKITKI